MALVIYEDKPQFYYMTRTLHTATVLLLLISIAAANESQAGNKYAIIIAVSQYDDERISSLPLVANDASALANTLHQRGGFEIIPLYESFDPSVPTSSRTVPTKANIMSKVSRVLKNCMPGDTVFLYFSGHGVQHPRMPGKTYLLPRDADVAKISDTFLETAWLRDLLAGCEATTKFFVIDACHAGGEKSVNLDSDNEQHKSLTSHELVDHGITGVVTLASSTKNQLSYFWHDQRMSIFSYWLNEGLKGHADTNNDGIISFQELDEYVAKNVSKTASEIPTPTPQTPVRIIGSDVPSVPIVMSPRAVSLGTLLDDLAEQIAAAMRIHNVKRTGVLEFSMIQGERSLANTGSLGAYCAEQLEELIKYRLPRRDGFRVVAREAVEKALTSKGVGPGELFDSTISEQNITINDLPLESYVVGTIESQRGGEIRFRCVLVSVDDIERLHIARGTAILTESEWGMMGRSFARPETIPTEVASAAPVNVVSENVTVANPENFLPPSPGVPAPVRVAYRPVSAQMVNWVDDNHLQMPHPLLARNRPLDVMIAVRQNNRNVARSLKFKNNEAFVPLRMGDVYQIRLRNHHHEFIAARVLVDGLNTLPQNPLPKNTLPQYKFAAIEEWVEERGGASPVIPAPVPLAVETVSMIAPRVNLDSARYWLLPPGFNGVVPGFFESTGSNAVGREFRVTAAPRSEATQKGFTEQIGIITVAYYSTKKIQPPPAETEREKRARIASLRNRGALGTELGRQFETNLQTRDDLELDQLLGIIHIHYSDEAFVGDSVPVPVTTPGAQPRQTTPLPVPQRQPAPGPRWRR